jgi:hypothetical protein
MPADLPMQEAEGGAAVPRREVPEMTLADLQEQCWAALPPIRKRLAGRQAVDDIVTLAVENWAGEYLNACQDNDQRGVYVTALLGQVKRGHQVLSGKEPQEYGFIWMILLQAVAVAAIEWLVKWWLDRRANRVLMTVWQHELTK